MRLERKFKHSSIDEGTKFTISMVDYFNAPPLQLLNYEKKNSDVRLKLVVLPLPSCAELLRVFSFNLSHFASLMIFP